MLLLGEGGDQFPSDLIPDGVGGATRWQEAEVDNSGKGGSQRLSQPIPRQTFVGELAGGVEGGEETALREALVNLGDAVEVNVAEGIP